MLYVGNGQDEKALRKYISDLKMDDRIKMCGKVTDRELLADYYARSDLFLFPSLYDASSIVQIEAASQSTPCVFVKGAATAATVTDNVNGFLADNDPESYSERIMEIMDNEELYRKASLNARSQLYVNWDDKMMEVMELYRELIRKHRENLYR